MTFCLRRVEPRVRGQRGDTLHNKNNLRSRITTISERHGII